MSIHQVYFNNEDTVSIVKEFDTVDEAYEYLLDNNYMLGTITITIHVRSVYDPSESLDDVDEEFGYYR